MAKWAGWRYLLVALLVVLLAADLGYRAWSQRPYIVTAYADADQVFTVEYTLPGGKVGTWRQPARTNVASCFLKAEIGKPIPACLRSMKSVLTTPN